MSKRIVDVNKKRIPMPAGATPPPKVDYKFCINCKHCIKHDPPTPFPPSLRCHNPNAKRDMVNGSWPVCSVARSNQCGISGSWFEPRHPMTDDEISAYFDVNVKVTPAIPRTADNPWSAKSSGFPSLGENFWWWVLVLATITIGLIVVTQY